jgi:hypothetical protein
MINPEIDEDGNKFWHNSQGRIHRDDGPAIEWFDGDKCWYQNGLRHREDGPAEETNDGKKWWYIKGKRIT